MSLRLRVIALLALVVTSLSACVVVPVPARRAYIQPAPVIVAPYPYYPRHGYRRW